MTVGAVPPEILNILELVLSLFFINNHLIFQ